MSNEVPTVTCPRCKKPAVFTIDNPSRPFCSERCQLLDLGRWADGKYAVPGEPVGSQAEVNKNDEDDGEENKSSESEKKSR
jgi:uncharacterized protein